MTDYTHINDFAYVVTHFPKIKTEDVHIAIHNAISPTAARKYGVRRSGKANIVASTLVQHGFTVDNVVNSTDYRPRTVAYVYDHALQNSDTIDALTFFMDVDVYTGEVLSGDIHESDVELYIGNNFLESYKHNPLWK